MSQIEEKITGIIRKLAAETLSAEAKEIDREHRFPREHMRLLGETGMHELIVSEKNGGVGLGRTAFTAAVKELAKACASTSLIYVMHAAAIKAIETGASDEVKQKWLPKLLAGEVIGAFAVHEPECGSNAGAIATRAIKERDEYIVNGSKFFITSAGEADVYVVLARTAPEKGAQGISTLLIEKDTPGLSFGKPEDKMGLTGTSSREMSFNNCRVPAENLIGNEGEGTQIVGKTLVGWCFYGAAAISVGIARSAAEIAIKHSKERMIAGQPIAGYQAVQSMITDMYLKADVMEAFLDHCALQTDSLPDKVIINAFKAKLFASETAIEAANLAIQIMGGHGYCRDYVVERLFRDARGLTLHFKTSEWLRQDIAKLLTGI